MLIFFFQMMINFQSAIIQLKDIKEEGIFHHLIVPLLTCQSDMLNFGPVRIIKLFLLPGSPLTVKSVDIFILHLNIAVFFDLLKFYKPQLILSPSYSIRYNKWGRAEWTYTIYGRIGCSCNTTCWSTVTIILINLHG